MAIEAMEIKIRVRQECILSPMLFNMYLADIFEKVLGTTDSRNAPRPANPCGSQ